jgi:all-trans-retinol 13,14-reductase
MVLIDQLLLLPLLTFFFWLSALVVVGSVAFLFYLSRFPEARTIVPRRASHFRPELVPTKLDTIVIGSGSGGSCCSNLLAQSGQKVLVLEQHEVTGGCTHSFREQNCEWDTGLHYVPKDMADKTARAGAIMDFMTHGAQKWTPFPSDEPYDEVVFPPDDNVKEGAPNNFSYSFFPGEMRTVDAVTNNIDPSDPVLKERAATWMAICREINSGFVALGMSRILPKWLQFLVRERVDRYVNMTC